MKGSIKRRGCGLHCNAQMCLSLQLFIVLFFFVFKRIQPSANSQATCCTLNDVCRATILLVIKVNSLDTVFGF